MQVSLENSIMKEDGLCFLVNFQVSLCIAAVATCPHTAGLGLLSCQLLAYILISLGDGKTHRVNFIPCLPIV